MRIIFFSLLISLIYGSLLGQDGASERDNTPKYSNEFMNIGVGARSMAMGSTAISFVGDVTSGYWNPAGLLQIIPDHQMTLMHSSYFGGLANYDYAAFATSLDEQSKISLSVIRFSVDDIPDTRFLVDVNGAINYDNISFFSSADYGFLLSYARHLSVLGGIKTGGSIKIIHRTVGSFSKAWGFGIDMGVQKDLGKWKVGAIARDIFGTFNAWSHNADEFQEIYERTGNDVPINSLEITLPRLILGGSRFFSLSNKFGLIATMDWDVTFDGKRNTRIRTDFISIDPKVGLEFDYLKKVFVRMGVNQMQQIRDFDRSTSWTFQPNAGVGFKLKDFSIDYALTDVGDLAPGLFSHVFSIKVDFNVED